ncbi:MAG: NAD(P)/FAD-dependent oxidoreductase [Candidatus Omnitrophica bacterium]|nr:NAD(P)/FAD-dependent oxidoreductase [Candidatus Omnitrophota bacterium]
MQKYDVIVIGAGPAGMMAAVMASERGKRVAIIEKNAVLGKKLLITGKGRCNITNKASIDSFLEKFGKRGQFYRTAFHSFFNTDLINFFKEHGLEMKAERQGRVFPITDDSHSVVGLLQKCLKDRKVEIFYNTTLLDLEKKDERFFAKCEKKTLNAKTVVLATGGDSFRVTGSTGDGYRVARKLGHTTTALLPGLVPLKTKERWVKDLQGLTLKNIRITFKSGKKKIVSGIGELLFTHFGVSGPLVLDLSAEIMSLKSTRIELYIDLKPGLDVEGLKNRLLKEFKGASDLGNALKKMLPRRLINVFADNLGLDLKQKVNQISRVDRRLIADSLKALSLSISGSLSLEEAMVTCGGVSQKEINPRTMESKIISGLYFAGEIIDGAAASGGYNLQQAFSTGYLAGESSAK